MIESDGLSPASIALVIAGCWLGLTLLVSLTGWSRLARHYTSDAPFSGDRFRLQSAGFRRGPGYNRGVHFGHDAAGLHLSVAFWLRPGHPPLFIPWSDISACRRRALWVQRVDLAFERAPGVELRITPRLAERLARARPDRWPPVRSDPAS